MNEWVYAKKGQGGVTPTSILIAQENNFATKKIAGVFNPANIDLPEPTLNITN